MDLTQLNSQGGVAPVEQSGGSRVRVLSLDRAAELLLARNQALRAQGYTVTESRTSADAMAALGRPPQVIIFGHLVPEHERNLIASAARASYPGVKIVVLCQGGIRDAGPADALVTVSDDPSELVKTVAYLLAGAAACLGAAEVPCPSAPRPRSRHSFPSR